MTRPPIDHYMMGLAMLAATRATCCRRMVGCILTNKLNHIIATGYNGVPRGMVHCTDVPCAGATAPSGTGLDACMATHAEQNALLQCKDVESIFRCYTTAAPCITCTKLLLNTGCQEIVFLEPYPHAQAQILWKESGRTWTGFNSRDQIALSLLMHNLSQSPALISIDRG
jgi:dCMP deaminase